VDGLDTPSQKQEESWPGVARLSARRRSDQHLPASGGPKLSTIFEHYPLRICNTRFATGSY